MKRMTCSFLFLFLSICAVAQTDREQVEKAGNDYIDAFYLGDSTAISRSILPNVTKYGYWYNKEKNTYEGSSMSYEQMFAYARNVRVKNKPVDPKWPRKVEVLDLTDQIAVVKITAWWGYDYLTIGKVNGKWMIHHIIWKGPYV